MENGEGVNLTVNVSQEPLLDLFLFETSQLLEQLEQGLLAGEEQNIFDDNSINEIFRIMHTIKGSAAMMMLHHISAIAHSLEDLFYCLREEKPQKVEYSTLTDIVFEASDFIKAELNKLNCDTQDWGDEKDLIARIQVFLHEIKMENNILNVSDKKRESACNITSIELNDPPITKCDSYTVTVFFEKDCQMEDTRALALLNDLREEAEIIGYYPKDILDNDQCGDVIRQEGFHVTLKTNLSKDKLQEYLYSTPLVNEVLIMKEEEQPEKDCSRTEIVARTDNCKKTTLLCNQNKHVHQNMISVNVEKLDLLMDLVGELVISEAMVVQNPELSGLKLDNFQKSARQLQKLTNELRDAVMSVRMVPLSSTFHKMLRIVRDMSKNLQKETQLKLLGEDTEVDKNIIEKISDPLMHLVRNAIDHGIETSKERKAIGKPEVSTITLEARNVGSDVLIIVKDDGKGLSKDTILNKAEENGLLYKPVAEMSDREIYNLIFLPGFSTKETISEYSGRGVGMDVVSKNVESIGGTVSVESEEGIGTSVILKIPLTLAIIDGMNIKVGESRYTIPISAIRESFKPVEKDILKDPDGLEFIMVRGQSYPILRLHEYFQVNSDITNFTDGIFIMVEQEERSICIFADELMGQQQVVVKSLPSYIRNRKRINGLAGCTLLGDGRISLILDIGSMLT